MDYSTNDFEISRKIKWISYSDIAHNKFYIKDLNVKNEAIKALEMNKKVGFFFQYWSLNSRPTP
jgi:hypothetical protein